MTRSPIPSPEGCFLPVIYEDESLLVLNKLTGVPSLPHTFEETRTAVNAALAHCPTLIQVGEKKLEAGLVHRLDTPTSGLLVFAKTQTEYQRLTDLWKLGEVKKTYRAWVQQLDQPLPPLPHLIDFPLYQRHRSSKKMQVLDRVRPYLKAKNRIQKARTWVDKIHQEKENPHLLDLEMRIETGVRHQIRCHLAALHFPLVGDPLYNRVPLEFSASIPRLMLHAWKIQIPIITGNPFLDLEAPLPSEWKLQ